MHVSVHARVFVRMKACVCLTATEGVHSCVHMRTRHNDDSDEFPTVLFSSVPSPIGWSRGHGRQFSRNPLPAFLARLFFFFFSTPIGVLMMRFFVYL